MARLLKAANADFVFGEYHERVFELFRRPGCQEAAADWQNMVRRLRLDSQANDAVMGLAAPICPVGEIEIKGNDCQSVFNGVPEQRFVVTTLELYLGGVKNLVAVPAQGASYFDPHVLVEE